MEASTFTWTTTDGIKIHARHWPLENPKAVVGIVHGMGEHVERYAHVAQAFQEAGIAVLGYDRRGHGQSGGKRGHTSSFQAFLDEIESLFQEMKKAYPESTYFLYGHSMGGNLVLNYLLTNTNKELKAVLASAPWIALAFEPPAIKITLAKIIRFILPGLVMKNELNPDGISRDKVEVKRYVEDPLVHDKITPNTGVFMMNKAAHLNSYSGSIDTPLLIMHGSKDPIISFDASKAFSERVKGNVEFKVWEDYYHEAHNDLNKEAVIEFMVKWFSDQL